MTAEKKSTTSSKKKGEDLLKAHKGAAHKAEEKKAHAPAKKTTETKAAEHKPEHKPKTEAKTEAKKPAEPKAAEKPKTEKKEATETAVPAVKPEAAPAETKKEEAPKGKAVKKIKKVKKEKPIQKIEFTAKETKAIEGKKKKPAFIRQEYYKLPRLKLVWRKPRGIDSKQHQGKKGKPSRPDVGYGTPEEVRGMHGAGYFPVIVCNAKDLEKIDSKTQAAVIASAVGRKKRNDIILAANKLKVIILNPRKGEAQ